MARGSFWGWAAVWLGVVAGGRLQADAPELRGLWVDAFNPGIKSAAEVRQLVADARAGRFNALFVQVRKRGDSYYRSSWEPRATDLASSTFDPLAELVRLAHEATPRPDGTIPQRLEVHAWIVAFNIWNRQSTLPTQPDHPYRTHPEWLTRSSTGATWDGANYAFDPGHPEVQEHTHRVAMELVTRYGIDGLHWDYIRYAGREWGYHPVAVARFNLLRGRTGQPSPDDAAWLAFRRDQVTAVVRRFYLAAHAVRPDLKVSAATIAWAPGITSVAEWPTSAAFSTVLQDWNGWMREGILDLNIPMAYFRHQDRAGDWNAWSRFTKEQRYRRQAALGSALYLNSLSNSLVQWRSVRQPTSRAPAADGMVGYSYSAPATDATRTAFLQALTAPPPASPAGPLFTETVEPPAMTHLSDPSVGHVLGRVLDRSGTAADGAAVVLRQVATGATRTVVTDAQGWFGAVDLPAGEWIARVQPASDGLLRVARLVAGHARVSQPPWWEAREDADGDGSDNEAELVAGTDPTAADSRLQIRLELSTAGKVGVAVGPQVPGRRYRVERRDNLLTADWQEVATWEGPRATPLEDLAGNEAAFYRVRVELR